MTTDWAWASALAALLCATPVRAEIYKHVDESGRVTYSNVPIKGAQKLDLEPLPAIPAPAPAATKAKPSGTPAGFPRVDSQTQKKRDDMRLKILQEELVAEEKQLGEARQALAEGESTRLGSERNYQKYLDRVQQLKDTVSLHEKNVDALRREIDGLR